MSNLINNDPVFVAPAIGKETFGKDAVFAAAGLTVETHAKAQESKEKQMGQVFQFMNDRFKALKKIDKWPALVSAWVTQYNEARQECNALEMKWNTLIKNLEQVEQQVAHITPGTKVGKMLQSSY